MWVGPIFDRLHQRTTKEVVGGDEQFLFLSYSMASAFVHVGIRTGGVKLLQESDAENEPNH